MILKDLLSALLQLFTDKTFAVRALRTLFVIIFIKPLCLIILGLNIKGLKNLPKKGPALLIANHNSHLDTLVLMSLYPTEMIHKIRPVAAEEYFCSSKFMSWFSKNIMGILPIKRKIEDPAEDPFAGVRKSLENGEIVIIFPEGTRGKPEELSSIKSGIFRLVRNLPETPIVPIFLSGLGKALPKNEFLLVPFHANVTIGDPLPPTQNRIEFMTQIKDSFAALSTTV